MGRTAILGGGAFGASVAYQLALRGGESVIIEQQARAYGGASGNAAGFLAKAWGDGRVTEKLHRISAEMHRDLARSLGIASYRDGLAALKVDSEGAGKRDDDLSCRWIDQKACDIASLDTDAAQVNPADFCAAMLRGATSTGLCTLRTGTECVGIVTEDACADSNGQQRIATAVRLASGEEVRCDHVVVALGAWSCKLEDWLGVPLPVDGVLSTSFTFDAPEAVAAEPPAAVFCAEDSRGCHLEVYPRPDHSIYVAGCGGSRLVSAADLRADVLPPSDTNRPDAVRVAAAQRSLAALSSAFAADDASQPQQQAAQSPVQQQACMRPCAPDGLPIVGPLPSVANVYAATGGNVWGITWAPVVGKMVSEMILDDGGVTVLNPRAFSPRRFDTPTYRTLVNQRGRERSGAGRVGEQW